MNAPQAWMGIVIILNEALDELDERRASIPYDEKYMEGAHALFLNVVNSLNFF